MSNRQKPMTLMSFFCPKIPRRIEIFIEHANSPSLSKVWMSFLELFELVARKLALFAIFIYQVAFSRFFGGHCRFQPTCSVYAAECFKTLSVNKAFFYSIRRLLRCHPGGSYGYDPVPPCKQCSHQYNIKAIQS
jgi:putative membrane protein insertion efficiency factor